MNNFKQRKTIFIVILILIVIGAGFYWYYTLQKQEKRPQESSVRIEKSFKGKIVYDTDAKSDMEKLKNHCDKYGGEFKECGTICEPNATTCGSVCGVTCEFGPVINTSDWSRFSSNLYNFALSYPAKDWNIAEALGVEDPFPKVSFYLKPAGVPVNAPFDHFANISNVSVYPEGLGKEGLIGETREISEDFGRNLSPESKIYVLEDGTPFAAYIKFKDTPQNWKDAGFVWARLKIDNLETKCLKNGEKIAMEKCDPLMGEYQIIRSGSVDESLWPVMKEVVNSIEFVENENISVSAPEANQDISSPLVIEGEARGSWFFEGQFNAVLTDWDGRIIAETPVKAEGKWTTEDFVPFSATLSFKRPYSAGAPSYMKNGKLILHKANPSGLPENSYEAIGIPIRFE